jgi:diguanylate cyclase (GGDEF)-like protein
MQAVLAQQAITDPLTGALNRRGFFERAADLWKKAAPLTRISAILLDVDHFKSLNDKYGHAAGDDVLAAIANKWRELGHSVGRLGGEEFAVLLNCALDDASDAAETLRLAIEGLAIHTNGSTIFSTCSFGVAESEPGDTIDSLLRRADMALYEAKRQGRNRVVGADTYLHSKEHSKWRGVARTKSRLAQRQPKRRAEPVR